MRGKRASRLLLLAALAASAFAALPAGSALAALERARISWTGPNDAIDIHVTDSLGNGAAAQGNSIPNTVYVGDNSGERVQTFTDLDDPSTRTFCYSLDNYGSDPTTVAYILTNPDGTQQTGSLLLNPGDFIYIGSSPAGETINPDGQCGPDIELANTVEAGPVSGTVLVKQPGTSGFVPLDQTTTVPVGSQFDTTAGHMMLTSETAEGGTQSIEYFDGLFKVTQKSSDQITAALVDSKKACKGSRGGRSARGAQKTQLWGRGSGNHKSKGRGGSGSARGTEWLTRDLCNGKTLFKVKEGSVQVKNFKNNKKTLVEAGEKITVGPKR